MRAIFLLVPAIAAGLGATVKHFMKNVFGTKKTKYTQTIQYPDVKVEYPKDFTEQMLVYGREYSFLPTYN